MSNNEISSVEWYINNLIEILGDEICNKLTIEQTNQIHSLGNKAVEMHKEEIDAKIQKAIEKFEEAKNKASTLRDVMYLDGVLSILDTIKNETFGEK